MAQHVDRKLCLTAAVLGAVSRKDLAAAFRRVNPGTPFDLERSHKWLQGRAQPRDARLYDDWAVLLAIGRPGAWIAGCGIEDFVDALISRGPLPREALEKRICSAASRKPRAIPSWVDTSAIPTPGRRTSGAS